MNPQTHYYQTEIEWVQGRQGRLSAEGLPKLAVCTPPEFKGEAGFWTPEHLLVGAAETCLMATFLGIAENSRLRVAGYRSTARGTLAWVEGGGYRFTEIVLGPVVELENEADRSLAERVMANAAKGCLVTKSMTALARVEPTFEVRLPAAA
jgi:organic hydroperoxide reductase OsmC/OhrA